MERSAKSSALGSARTPDALMDPPPATSPGVTGIMHEHLTVFQQPWWLQIVKGDSDYREMEVRQAGVLVGSLAFIVVRNKLGNKLAFPPIWSHLGGPAVSQYLSRDEKIQVIRQLIQQLPGKISYKFVCSSDGPDRALAKYEFQAAGFQCSTEGTYLQYPGDLGILDRLTGESRRQIASARKKVEIIEIGADEFIAFYGDNLAAGKKRSYASLESARNLIVRGQQPDLRQVRVIAARQRSEGALLDAAIAFAWDHKRYYLWMVTHRASKGNSGGNKAHPHAGKLLIVEGTEDARRRGLIFDADGATTTGNQMLYRDRLKFPHTEFRDVFTRDTMLYKLYKRLPKSRAPGAAPG